MSPIAAPTEAMLCHCIRVSEGQVRDAVELDGCESVREVRKATGAGSGCTACHHKICALIQNRPEACPAVGS